MYCFAGGFRCPVLQELNIIFCRPENMKITEKEVLKTQWIQSPKKYDSLCPKMWLRRKLSHSKGFRRKDIKGELVMLFSHCRHTVTT